MLHDHVGVEFMDAVIDVDLKPYKGNGREPQPSILVESDLLEEDDREDEELDAQDLIQGHPARLPTRGRRYGPQGSRGPHRPWRLADGGGWANPPPSKRQTEEASTVDGRPLGERSAAGPLIVDKVWLSCYSNWRKLQKPIDGFPRSRYLRTCQAAL